MSIKKTDEAALSRYIQLFSLVFIALAESFTMLFGSSMSDGFIYFGTMCVNMAAALVLGISIARFPRNKTAGKLLLTGGSFCGLIALLQLLEMRYFSLQWSYDPQYGSATIFCEYMVLLPMAALLDEKEKDRGLRYFSLCYLMAIIGLVLLTFELFQGKVPEAMQSIMQWQGTRLSLMWHPNVLAGILLTGLGFTLSLAFYFKKAYWKVPLFLLSAIEFYMIVLTNARAVAAMASCILGGMVFCLIFNGSLKRFIVGIIAAVIVIVSVFAGTVVLYSGHVNKFVENVAAEQLAQAAENVLETEAAAENPEGTPASPEEQSEAEPAEAPTVNMDDIEYELKSESAQQSFKDNLPSFNGRTGIWKAIFLAMKDHPAALLKGTGDIGELISPYNSFYVYHAHNSWLQVFAGTGLIGFGMILYLTWLAIKSSFLLIFRKASAMYQKIIALTVIAIMGAQFFEVYLFYVEYPRNFIQMAFMLCLGYVIYWADMLPDIEKEK